jgi:hypothetical protein
MERCFVVLVIGKRQHRNEPGWYKIANADIVMYVPVKDCGIKYMTNVRTVLSTVYSALANQE